MMNPRYSLTGMSALVAACLCGCALRGDTELLETRLRQQEDRLARMESELQTAESELMAARGESRHLRQQLASRDAPALLPEQADSLFRATGIQFNRLLTGGYDRDRETGDELLSAIIVPHDADGELVKIPGEIELEAFDLSRDGEQTLIGKWKYGADESHDLWHSGFLGSGYLVRVPWMEIPRSPRLLLHARLVTADGRRFDTSEHIEVTPPIDPEGILHSGGAFQLEKSAPRLLEDRSRDPEPSSKSMKPTDGDSTSPAEQGRRIISQPVETSDRWTEEMMPFRR